MLQSRPAERARRRIESLCRSGLDAPSLLTAVAAAVREVVAYDGAFWATTDPATLLITGAHVEDLPRESAAPFYENEYQHDDVNKFTRLARGLRPVASMSEATEGRLERSRLHREVGSAFGFRGDALRAAFVAGSSCWGVASLGRRKPRPHFDQADLSFLASVCAPIGEGLRASLLLDALAAPTPSGEGPGLVLLAGDGSIASASAGALAWLEELAEDFGLRPGERAPAVLLAVSARARDPGGADPTTPETPPRARVRTRSGRWLVLHGLELGRAGAPAEHAAVIVEPAAPPEIAPLIVEAYGLSPREREVAQLVILGASTAEIARALSISPYTVQDHLKSVFERVGVRSRGEMVLRILHRHRPPGGGT
jgi:DNA-binding CsgD family transcriptional regulator